MIRSSQVVVLDPQAGTVLLIQRGDLPLWVLPGGVAEVGESAEAAAAREAFEETGYQVRVERQTGEYACPQLGRGGSLASVFLATIVGGQAIESGPETRAVRWFPLAALPRAMPRLHRQRLADALADDPLVIRRTQLLRPWHAVLLRAFLWLRDRARQR
ncbi:MAG: NUDIX domain-containing protein [Gemmatimonadota bacterium]